MSKFRFVQLSTYTTPEIKEVRNQDFIAYGEDNNYFQYLIDRYNGSATNNAIINGISAMIFGRGLDATDSNKQPEEYAKMKTLFTDDCTKKLAADLKLMGQCAYQVIYNKERTQVAQVEHFPVETLRAEKCNEEGDIEAYYYFHDWSEYQKNDTLTRIPAFGFSNEDIEIVYIKPYRAGFQYYSPVDYQGGLQYAELEEEIANYHLNNIMNGLAPSMMINFNNGIPEEETQALIEQKIREKFSGSSNAGRFILAFNDGSEQAGSIEPVQLSDAHQQYEFLSTESMSKLMVAHRVISPMLLGIKDNTGLGNNAEELQTASTLMDNTVIRPFQGLLIESFNEVLAFNNVSLKLYFKTLQPLEFVDLENAMTKEQVEEETGQKLSLSTIDIDGKTGYDTKDEAIKVAEGMGCGGYHEHEENGKIWYMPCASHSELKKPCWDGYEQIGTKIKDGKEVPNCVPLGQVSKMKEEVLDALLGLEDEDFSAYSIVDERPANEHDDYLAKSLNLASVVSSSPNRKSEQDTSLFKVRYVYTTGGGSSTTKSRDFCQKMMSASKVYRKEDLDKQSSDNSELAPKGSSTYNIFLYKGGVNCKHYWMRRVYIRKNNRKITVNRAKELINELDPSLRSEAKFETNPIEVAQIASSSNDYWRKN